MAAYPALPIFVFALTALFLKATLLSVVQVVARLRARTFLVPEDAMLMHVPISDREHPFVVRCGNVWRNDLENVPLFLAIALAFTMLGGTAGMATWIFGGFVAVRYLHTVIYLRGVQPWRAVAFLTGLALTWSLVITNVWLMFDRGWL